MMGWLCIVALSPVLILLPAVVCMAARLALRRGRRLRSGRTHADLCPTCGYDLRASPQRCPECGATRAKTTT